MGLLMEDVIHISESMEWNTPRTSPASPERDYWLNYQRWYFMLKGLTLYEVD